MLSSDTIDINVELTVGSNLNPDSSGRPSPVELKLFQLTNDSKFIGASVVELLQDSDAALSADIISFDQTMVFPGESKEYELVVDKNADFIGVFAAFQDEGESSKKIIDMTGGWFKDICITLNENQLVTAERC